MGKGRGLAFGGRGDVEVIGELMDWATIGSEWLGIRQGKAAGLGWRFCEKNRIHDIDFWWYTLQDSIFDLRKGFRTVDISHGHFLETYVTVSTFITIITNAVSNENRNLYITIYLEPDGLTR